MGNVDIHHHPFRDADLHVYRRVSGDGCGQNFLALFWPYNGYPISFSGSTEAEVREKAEAFRADAVARYEAAFVARAQALQKAREAKERKKASIQVQNYEVS